MAVGLATWLDGQSENDQLSTDALGLAIWLEGQPETLALELSTAIDLSVFNAVTVVEVFTGEMVQDINLFAEERQPCFIELVGV